LSDTMCQMEAAPGSAVLPVCGRGTMQRQQEV
jgi:hypothetical protein